MLGWTNHSLHLGWDSCKAAPQKRTHVSCGDSGAPDAREAGSGRWGPGVSQEEEVILGGAFVSEYFIPCQGAKKPCLLLLRKGRPWRRKQRE